MNSLSFGIVTILFCSLGYCCSWRFQARDNFKIAVLILVLCGLALRIFTSADFYLHEWDERYHALVAKNLIQHPLMPTLYENPLLPYDYKNWTANHIWLHKQPLPLWTMALSMWLFGVNEIALRLPSILLTTTGIWLTFSIANFFFNKKVGYLSAFFYSVNGLIIELTGGRVPTDHIDIFFLFFIQSAIYFSIVFSQKRNAIYNILTGLSIGAAILSKWLPALIVLPVWILVVADSGNFRMRQMIFHFFVLTVTCILVFLPWQLYIFKSFPAEASWESGYNLRHITEVLEERTGSVYYFIEKIRISFGDLIYLPLLWFVWLTIKNPLDKKRLAIFIWFCVPLLFFSFAKTKMPAYLLFTSPALFMMTAAFWQMLSAHKANYPFKWLFNLMMVLLIALPIRYSAERIKPFEKSGRLPLWVAELKELNERKISNGVLFNYDRPVEAMFYTNLTVYPGVPDKEIVIDLIRKGFQVIIHDDGNIPAGIKEIENVMTVNFTAGDCDNCF